MISDFLKNISKTVLTRWTKKDDVKLSIWLVWLHCLQFANHDGDDDDEHINFHWNYAIHAARQTVT